MESSIKIVPKKLGIKLSPLALIYIYEKKTLENNKGKLRLRTIPLRILANVSSTDFVLEDLRARHGILDPVPDSKIIKMIEIAKQVGNGKKTLEEVIINNKTLSEKSTDKKVNKIIREQSAKHSMNHDQDDEKEEKPTERTEEDTDFEIDDDLPLDKLESEDDDFWNL